MKARIWGRQDPGQNATQKFVQRGVRVRPSRGSRVAPTERCNELVIDDCVVGLALREEWVRDAIGTCGKTLAKTQRRGRRTPERARVWRGSPSPRFLLVGGSVADVVKRGGSATRKMQLPHCALALVVRRKVKRLPTDRD